MGRAARRSGTAPGAVTSRSWSSTARTSELDGGGRGEGAYSAATGRLGPGVTGVDLLTARGTVRASTANGRWTAWWPGADGGQGAGQDAAQDGGPVRVVVHTAAGETTSDAADLVP